MPNRINGVTHEIMVNVGKITSSPSLRSSALIAASRAEDPLVTETAYFFLQVEQTRLQTFLQTVLLMRSILNQCTHLDIFFNYHSVVAH